ncbi:hypothetical protein G6F56_003127 [Rhizopus delemar]|nr:hypothetical protein G6F56_003127 [Rhizopus delemar]
MRVKFKVEESLLQFWFSTKEDDTIKSLQERVISDLKLSWHPNKVTLFLEDCMLLSEHYVKDVLRENDVICLKSMVPKKRKPEGELLKVSNNEKTDKKAKREDKEIQKKYDRLSKKFKKLRKEKEIETQKEREKIQKQQEKIKKDHERMVNEHKKEQERLTKEYQKQNEASEREKKKLNEEKKKFKEEQKELKNRIKEIKKEKKLLEKRPVTTDNANNEISKNPATVPAGNTNDNVGSLEQPDLTGYGHDWEDFRSSKKDFKNLYGRAIVTYSEVGPQHRLKKANNNNPPPQFPIDKVPRLFYAEQQSEIGVESEEVPETENTLQADETSGAENTQVDKAPAVINYEELPKLDFDKNMPSVGDHLATLELTATYTPEVSDWKEVILEEIIIENQSVVVKFLQGFSKASTKGGKFELKKKRDDYYYEMEEEEPEETSCAFLFTDIFDIRKL